MRRIATASALLAAVALGACGGGGDTKSTTTGNSSGGTAASRTPATITLWNGFTNRELGVVKQAVDAFHQTHPWITVKAVGGVNDDKIIAAIRGGNSPDVAQSFTADNTGLFCSSGGWIDLKPYMDAAKIDASMFPSAVQTYTQYKGKRCALPMLADTYGLYYNKALFKKAGIAAPPKTMSELTADAKKLTVPDRNSFKVVDFDPAQGFYENAPAHYGPVFGAQWVDGSDKSVISKQQEGRVAPAPAQPRERVGHHTGLGTVVTRSSRRRATRGSLVSRWGMATASPRSGIDSERPAADVVAKQPPPAEVTAPDGTGAHRAATRLMSVG